MTTSLDDSTLFAHTETSLNTSSLLATERLNGPESPSSPASRSVYVRNLIFEYIDEIRSLVAHLHEIHYPGLPELYATAIEDSVSSVDRWLREDSGHPEVDMRLALERLQDEMTASGVTLYLEVLTKEDRKTYYELLASFLEWLQSTQCKTGADQPLTEAERAIMTDFAVLEKRWAEREDSISAPRREFVERARMIRELRNDEIERQRKNEYLASIMERFSDGSAARRRQLFKHVGNRAAMLRATPKDNLSVKQRRDCKHIATSVMAWIDEHFYDGTYEDLADQLQRVCETAQETSAAAEVVARRNELLELLDFVRSSITVQREVMDALGPDRVEGLAFVVAKCEHWLDEHPNPTIQTLEKFVESLRLAASKLGLSPPTVDAPVPAPASVVANASTTAAGEGEGAVIPGQDATKASASSSSTTEQLKKLQIVNVACVMLEQLQVLRVACTAGGAVSFIARRIAPLQLELEEVLQDRLALEDGAAPLLRRYKAVLLAAKTEAKGCSVPASCFTHVLPFEDVELE